MTGGGIRPAMRRVLGTAAAIVVLLLIAVADGYAEQCSVSTTSVSFGSYNVFAAAPTDSTGSLVYRCNGNAVVWISLSRGLSSTFEGRTLTSGNEELLYNLYRDAARTAIWGDGSSGTQLPFDLLVPKNTNVTLTIYGRIPAGQDVRAGTYTDTVSVVVNF